MKLTLVILAAGMGSRYGGLKQLDKFGVANHSIIEYSVYDAICAGFSKVVFVIREHFAKDFIEIFDKKLSGKIETEYVFQELNKVPHPELIDPERTKPWGTGHALLMAKDEIKSSKSSFLMINADDFYSREAFIESANYLKNSVCEDEYCMIGYKLKNTLSENGSVSRGVCVVDSSNFLTEINERTDIRQTDNGIFYFEKENKKDEIDDKKDEKDDGKEEVNTKKVPLTGDELVSMNCWAFKHGFFDYLEKGFADFFKQKGSELKSEYYFINEISPRLANKTLKVKVLECNSQWFGITYPEDKLIVSQKIDELIEGGVYPVDLWG